MNRKLVNVIALVFLVVTTFAYLLSNDLRETPTQQLSVLVAVLTASYVFKQSSDLKSKSNKAIEKKEAEIKEIEKRKSESISKLLERQIDIAIGHEELTMLVSERRANTLYSLGQWFLVTSVLCPIFSLIAYWYIEPLPQSTIQQLLELRDAIEGLPVDLSVTIQRDWRILVGGVSFGFLLLAAATGLLRQQAREIGVYFTIADRVNLLRKLKAVLAIQYRRSSGGNSPVDQEMIELVSRTLLDPQSTNVGDGESRDALDTKGLLDVAKSLGNATT